MHAAVALRTLQLLRLQGVQVDPVPEAPNAAPPVATARSQLPESDAVTPPCAECVSAPGHAEAELLIRQWQAGKKAAATSFYYLYKDRVYRWARMKTRDPHAAEDLCQEVWRRIHRSLLTYRFGTSPNAWIYRILINTHRSLWRRGERFLTRFLQQPAVEDAASSEGLAAFPILSGASPEVLFTRKQELGLILKAMREIPESFRQVVFLRYIEGLPIDEVAHILGVSEGTVKSRLNRGLEKLRERLGACAKSWDGGAR